MLQHVSASQGAVRGEMELNEKVEGSHADLSLSRNYHLKVKRARLTQIDHGERLFVHSVIRGQ